MRVNVIGNLNVADLCFLRKIHLTLMATGCIYEYDGTHAIGSGIGFTEKDVPNFAASWYSKTKGHYHFIALYNNLLVFVIQVWLNLCLQPTATR